MDTKTTIAHYDLDSFFVSVEILLDPSLKGKPVIVGGKEKGVVATCSYEARKFGVHSAMPSAQAVKLCPHGIFLKGSYSEYSRYSRMVTDIIAARAPKFQKASVDEFYVDLTGMDKYFRADEFAIQLREEIIRNTGLPISFGLGSNKMIAKMATNKAKPNGFLIVPHGEEQRFLAPLAVEEIPGVGKATLPTLHGLGIFTISDILKVPVETLEEYLGKWGYELHEKAMGKGSINIGNGHDPKSISAETTFFENSTDIHFLEQAIVRLTERVCFQLRTDDKLAGCAAIKLRYKGFETRNKQCSISFTNADEDVIPVMKALFHQLYKKGAEVRLIGVKLTDFRNEAVQTNLFSDIEKKSDLYKAIDNVKVKFGKTMIKRASGQ